MSQQSTDFSEIDIDCNDPMYQCPISPTVYLNESIYSLQEHNQQNLHPNLFNSDNDLPPRPLSSSPSYSNNTDSPYGITNVYLNESIYNPQEYNQQNLDPNLFNNDNDFPQCTSPDLLSYLNNTDPQFGIANIYASENNDGFLCFDSPKNSNGTYGEPLIFTSVIQNPNEQNNYQDQSQESREDDMLSTALAIPIANQTIQNATTDQNSIKPTNIKKSKSENTPGFINSGGFYYLSPGVRFRLTAAPYEHQRARYEKELNEALRYVFVTENRSLTLELSDHPDRITHTNPGFNCYLQIFRTTVSVGDNNSMYIHPYPLWLNDKEAIVFNNTLLLPVKTQIIKLDRLIMQRAKQSELKSLDHLQIYSDYKLDFTDTHPIDYQEKAKLIETYQLRWSILHFRICMVNQDGAIWPTDLHCQTEKIREFEGPEVKSLPENVRTIMKESSKRKRVGEPNGNRTAKKSKGLTSFEEFENTDGFA